MSRYLEQLKHSKFDDNIYFLGNFEKRITVYSQQIRAINLVYSLLKEGIINEKSKVAIIGAGVAGITAACCSAVLNVKTIHVYERASSILPLWRDCKSRWLHPNIFNWPNDTWSKKSTELPILNWTADSASNVAKQIINQWDTTYDYFKNRINIKLFTDAKARISKSGKVESGNFGKSTKYDIILIGVGFGRDGNLNDLNTCYWANDNLDTLTDSQKNIFLSGNGDGGISDLLRIRTKHFDMEMLIKWLKSEEIRKKQEKIKTIEDKALKIKNKDGNQSANKFLSLSYKKLKTPKLNKLISDSLRTDTTVFFHARSEDIFNINSFPLNRFLLSRYIILQDKGFKFKYGSIKNLTGLKKSGKSTGKKIKIELDGNQPIMANEFITRHGPISPLSEPEFKWIFESESSKNAKARNIFDQTGKELVCTSAAFGYHKELLRTLSYENRIERVAVAIVKHKRHKKFLFTRRRQREGEFEWSFVAKSLRPFHNTVEAIRLECEEETGIICNVIEKIGSRIHPETNKLIEYWYCEHVDARARVKDTNELLEVKWLKGYQIMEKANNSMFKYWSIEIKRNQLLNL